MLIQQEEQGKQGSFFIKNGPDKIGELVYTIDDDNALVIEHTEVASKMEGKNIGRNLVEKAVMFARGKNYKVVPACSFAANIFKKEPAYSDVLKDITNI